MPFEAISPLAIHNLNAVDVSPSAIHNFNAVEHPQDEQGSSYPNPHGHQHPRHIACLHGKGNMH